MLIDILLDAAMDTCKLFPFLLLTYFIMEYVEHHTAGKMAYTLEKKANLGPLVGGVFGVLPQCGFSAGAASLFSGGVITVGTLLAVFLSTSDEMLPMMISYRIEPMKIVSILAMKCVIGIVSGLLVDRFVRSEIKKKSEKHIHDLCEQDHCGCEDHGKHSNIASSALRHTLQIAIYIFVCSFVLGLVIEQVGLDNLCQLAKIHPVRGIFLMALIGLIPNCGASVAITQLYLDQIISCGQMMAGLLVGAGVGLLVLFRANRSHMKENVQILIVLYLLGCGWGLLIQSFGIAL